MFATWYHPIYFVNLLRRVRYIYFSANLFIILFIYGVFSGTVSCQLFTLLTLCTKEVIYKPNEGTLKFIANELQIYKTNALLFVWFLAFCSFNLNIFLVNTYILYLEIMRYDLFRSEIQSGIFMRKQIWILLKPQIRFFFKWFLRSWMDCARARVLLWVQTYYYYYRTNY